MRYLPANSFYDRSLVSHIRNNSPLDIAHQPLWLLHSEDRSGRNDFTHGHDQWRARYRV